MSEEDFSKIPMGLWYFGVFHYIGKFSTFLFLDDFSLFWPTVHHMRWFWYLKNNKAKAKEILRPLLLKLITPVSSHPLKSGSEAIETTFWRSAAMKWRNTKKKLLHVQRAGKLNSLNGSNGLKGHSYTMWTFFWHLWTPSPPHPFHNPTQGQ